MWNGQIWNLPVYTTWACEGCSLPKILHENMRTAFWYLQKQEKKTHTHISSISSIISSISIWSQSIYWLGFYLQALRSLSSQTTNAFQCGPKSWPRPRFLRLGLTLKFWNISVLNTVVAMTSLEQHGDSRSYLAVQQVEWHPPFSNSSAASFNKEFAPSSRRKERKYCLFLPMEFLPI